jgi:hypothetical protein
MVFAAGQFLTGALIEDEVLFRRLIHADGDHGQAFGILVLALAGHAVVVLQRSLRVQLTPARDALRHWLAGFR